MAAPAEADPNPKPQDDSESGGGGRDEEESSEEAGNGGGSHEEGEEAESELLEDEEEEDEDEDEEQLSGPSAASAEKDKLKSLFSRLSTDPVRLRVHDVVIKGNAKTKDVLIEDEVLDLFRRASTVQDLIRAAGLANARLRKLDIFEAVSITLDAGPPELPGTTNVVIEVAEAANPLTGNVGVFSKPEARSWSVEGSLKLKNLFGYGDIWDASGAYGWDQTSEISVGVALPRFKAVSTPLMARASLLSQDWLKFSSYKERLMGLSFGLLSTMHHDLAYNLTWRSLTDPSRMASNSIRRQLGHSLLSALKYTYRIDQRNSHLRPTEGYAFQSTTQIGGLWDSSSARFVRQEFDLRGALPLRFFNAALNVGVAVGAIMPWGKGFLELPSPLPERFYLGGHSSPVCSLGGPSSLLGFRTRGLGPTEARRFIPNKSEKDDPASPGRDFLGGDLAVTAFADLSFDLPLKLFREAGIHGHTFICAGNLAKLTGDELKNFSVSNFLRTFRSSAGVGIIMPTKFFRVEINYCYILKQLEHDRGKTGIQFSFSSP